MPAAGIDRVEMAKRYVEDRRSIRELATEFGLTRWSVTKSLRLAGVRIRRTGASTPASDALAAWIASNGISALRELFVAEGRNVSALAKRFGLTSRPMKIALTAGDFVLHPKPTSEELQRLVHTEHRRYADIAALYGVSMSTVGAWVRSYGLQRPWAWANLLGREPYVPSEEEIRIRYESGMSLAEVGRDFDLSEPTIRKLCIRYGIPVRSGGWSGAYRVVGTDGHKVRSSYEKRVDDWLSARGIDHVYEPSLPSNARLRADFLVNGWYIEIWGVTRGGRVSTLYWQRRAMKVHLYESNALPLIEIEAWWFNTRLRGLWERRLAKCLSVPVQTRVLSETAFGTAA